MTTSVGKVLSRIILRSKFVWELPECLDGKEHAYAAGDDNRYGYRYVFLAWILQHKDHRHAHRDEAACDLEQQVFSGSAFPWVDPRASCQLTVGRADCSQVHNAS